MQRSKVDVVDGLCDDGFGGTGGELDDGGGDTGFEEDFVGDIVCVDGVRGGFPDDNVAYDGGGW